MDRYVLGFTSFTSIPRLPVQVKPTGRVTRFKKSLYSGYKAHSFKKIISSVDKSSTESVGKTGDSTSSTSKTTTKYGSSSEEASSMFGQSAGKTTFGNDLFTDPSKLSDKLQDFAEDVMNRPTFYAQILAATVGVVITVEILDAVVVALNRLPLLPRVFELVGLGYTGWFTWRYLLFSNSRAELKNKLDSFIGKATKQ